MAKSLMPEPITVMFNLEPGLEDTALSQKDASLRTQFGATAEPRPGGICGTFSELLLSI